MINPCSTHRDLVNKKPATRTVWRMVTERGNTISVTIKTNQQKRQKKNISGWKRCLILISIADNLYKTVRIAHGL